MAYLNVDEIESALENLAAAYPALTSLITAPHTTHEGRTSHILRMGAGDPSADGVLILGGMHAREWVPPDALVSFSADLLEAYETGTGLGYGGSTFTSAEVRSIVESVNIFVFACVNPDGRHFSQNSQPLWRKNRRPHSGGGSCLGVDINRNFDFLWDYRTKFAADSGVSASDNPCDANVYCGPAAESEPETRNVVWILDTMPSIRWHMDVHSAVPVILHSWGSDQNQSTQPAQTFLNSAFDGVRGRLNDTAYGEFIGVDDLELVSSASTRMNEAVKAVRGDDYGVEQAFGLYPTSGASDDYAFARHFADPARPKVYGFTVECGHNFQPSWAEAEDVIREVSAGLLSLCRDAAGLAGDSVAQVEGKDIALVRQTPGWSTIPVAFADGSGGWDITNGAAAPFIGTWANIPGVRIVTGDFNGNGLTDIALVRQTPGWSTIPVAFANGSGGWDISNGAAAPFIGTWANTPGVRIVTGDFNGNGLTDIALVRLTAGWSTIPVAFANGSGGWDITNGAAPTFIGDWANTPGVRIVTGDFNGNGLTDIALVRQTPGWSTIPVAFANGSGGWDITNGAAATFIGNWANTPGVRIVTGDYR